MSHASPLSTAELSATLTSERSRLVGLCATLTHNAEVAEDLAQETLYEAWRHGSELRDGSRCAQWLSGIARNVCLRWRQRQQRDSIHMVALRGLPEQNAPVEPLHALPSDSLDLFADDFDVELELERHELAALLDQAMALLPPATRDILVWRYIDCLAHVELAERLGISEGAVKVRLHRGKLALRRVLLDEFAEGASAFGYAPQAGAAGWDETRMWCSICGEQRLLGRLWRDQGGGPGEFILRCPRCFAERGLVYHQSDTTLLGGVRRYKPAMARIFTWADRYFHAALRQRSAACRNCGSEAKLLIHQGESPSNTPGSPEELRTLVITCPQCGHQNIQSHTGLILASPQGQAFLRMHPRIRLLPEREVEAHGTPALVTSFASVTDGARFDVISARETYDVLALHGVSAPASDLRGA